MGETFEPIRKAALDLGAVDARVIPTEDIVVENRVILRCKYWCNEYGKNWSCPPYAPSIEEFRKILKEYKHALVVKFQSAPSVDAWMKEKERAHIALLKLEKIAFEEGFTFALLLRPGGCNICPKCDVTRPCLHPEMLRFPPEAVGINLIETLKKAKMNLKFPVTNLEEKIDIVAILLIQ